MKKLAISLLASLSLMFAVALPVAAVDCNAANLSAADALQCGANGASGNNDATSKTATDSVNNLLSTVLNLLSVVIGLVAVIMIIVAGFKYITSGGKEDSVKSAKNTILYAIIGIVVVVLAQVIVQFVLNKATPITTSSSTYLINL